MSLRTHLTVAGLGLAGVYAVVALVELIAVGNGDAALVFGVSAAVTGGLIAILIPVLAPRRDDSGEDGDAGGPDGGGGGPPPPPWWPDFERAFWAHVERPRVHGPGPREKTPA